MICGSPAMPIQGEPGRRLALIVATSDYRDPTLHQLRAPGRDASDLAEVLGDPAIGIFDVRTLMDTPSDQLLRGIAQFCGQASPGDLLLIYLSCHGVLDDRGRLYYATIDTERSLLSATAVAAQWLTEQLDDSRAHRKILLLDCCHSGAFARGAKGGSELALKDRFSAAAATSCSLHLGPPNTLSKAPTWSVRASARCSLARWSTGCAPAKPTVTRTGWSPSTTSITMSMTPCGQRNPGRPRGCGPSARKAISLSLTARGARSSNPLRCRKTCACLSKALAWSSGSQA